MSVVPSVSSSVSAPLLPSSYSNTLINAHHSSNIYKHFQYKFTYGHIAYKYILKYLTIRLIHIKTQDQRMKHTSVVFFFFGTDFLFEAADFFAGGFLAGDFLGVAATFCTLGGLGEAGMTPGDD